MLLKDKVALITGAAGGIGAGVAETFAKAGAKAVLIVDINEEKAQPTVDKIAKICECKFFKCDVSDEAEVEGVFAQIAKDYGRLDVLVNAAGISSLQNIFEMPVDTWNKILAINLTGTYLFAREALKLMMEQKAGRIVNFASVSGQVGGIRTSAAYAASKGGILALTKSLAKVAAKSGVTVNSVAPGIAATEMTQLPGFDYSLNEIPLGYVSDVYDVADAVLFLASDLSRYVTGHCLSVNGGMYMGS